MNEDHKPRIVIEKPIKRWFHHLPILGQEYVDHLEIYTKELELDKGLLAIKYRQELLKHAEHIQKYLSLEARSKSLEETAQDAMTRWQNIVNKKADLTATLSAAKSLLEDVVIKTTGDRKVVNDELVVGPPDMLSIRATVESAIRLVTLSISKERGFTNSNDEHDDPNKPPALTDEQRNISAAIERAAKASSVLPPAAQPDVVASDRDVRTGEEVSVGLDGIKIGLFENQVLKTRDVDRIVKEVRQALERRID